jgi:hypothetical protein
MISIETSVCSWAKSSEPPLWSTKTVWLNPDHVVSIEVTNEKFRGTDVDEFTKVHTTKTHYITTEPADELARRLFDKVTLI